MVCGDGKTSEAAVFLLLRNKINAMILSGGMAGVKSDPEHDIAPNDIQLMPNAPKLFIKITKTAQSADSDTEPPNQVSQSEIEALKMTNQQLNDKCLKLELDKQHAEKQARILYKQLEKLTQVLDKLKK